MKMAFLVHSEYLTPRVMQLLQESGIDYYTRWDGAQGKGAGTEPHLGRGGYPSTNGVMMVAFEDDAPLKALIARIAAVNADVKRADDRVRLFQVPLERIV